MARGLTETELEAEWLGLPKDWYSIYQWKRTVGVGYSEWIAEWIAASFEGIRLVTDGLRAKSFRVADHRGQIRIGTGIEQLTEKRLVRAMFNVAELPLLGRVIDYEVPPKDAKEAAHGDIDLLCTQPGACLCVEAKKPLAAESILKAVLQGVWQIFLERFLTASQDWQGPFLLEVLAMESTPKLSRDEFIAQMRKKMEEALGKVSDAVNEAPPGANHRGE